MTSSGIDSQLGIVAESTFGTYVEPTRFYEITDESFKFDQSRVESKGIRTGRSLKHRWGLGVGRVNGGWNMELSPQGLGVLMNQMLGVGVIAGANPYTHTYDGTNDIDGTSFTTQIGRPDIGGTVRAFSYAGCKISDWEISAAVDEYATLALTVYGASEVTSESLATASYPAGLAPFIFTEGQLTVAGGAVCVRDISLSGTNALATDRHFVCTTGAVPKEPLINGKTEISGSFSADFTDLTQYGRYIAGTEAALVLTFDAGSSAKLVITMNVRFDGETPNVSGEEILEEPVSFVVTSGTSDAAAFTAVITNADAAA